VVGSLAEYNPSIIYASSFAKLRETYADNFAGLTEKSNSIFALELTGTSNSNIGAIAGINYGNITASVAIADLSVKNLSTGAINIGGLVGYAENAWINNSIAQNRVLVSKTTDITNVGGIAGKVSGSRFDAILANGNVIVFAVGDFNRVGLAFGTFEGISNGVVVNSDLSGNLSINDVNNNYNFTLTTQELLTASRFNAIAKNSANLFNSIWLYGNSTINYGYPYLSITNISMNTGNGNVDNPYQLREGTEILRVTLSNATGKHFVLVRDSIISSEILETTAKSTIYAKTLSGNGKVVIIDKYITPTSTGGTVNIGLFRTISEQTEIKGLGIVINQYTTGLY